MPFVVATQHKKIFTTIQRKCHFDSLSVVTVRVYSSGATESVAFFDIHCAFLLSCDQEHLALASFISNDPVHKLLIDLTAVKFQLGTYSTLSIGYKVFDHEGYSIFELCVVDFW
jgi:hypothetical protein